MNNLLWMIRVVGLQRGLKLLRAYRLAWRGIISGYYTTRIMQTLFNVGFFDEMQQNGGVNVEAFAGSHDLDANILHSLCDSLYELRILRKNGSGYSLDSKGRILVQVARGWFEGVYGYEEVFHSLEALLKKEKVYGRDITRRPEYIARGSGEMEKWLYFPLAIDMITRNRYKKVLDLGCGEATFLRDLCENSDVIGYGIDIAPEAIAEGKAKVALAGLQDRIHLFVEDITKLDEAPEALKGIEAATTFFVLHEILYRGADLAVELLRSFRTLFPGVPLIVFEVIRPTPEQIRRRPGMAVHYLLQHDLTHQKPVSLKEWQVLFEAAGFKSIEGRHSSFARTAIFIVR
jgi:SAM-dependent methyltransferase